MQVKMWGNITLGLGVAVLVSAALIACGSFPEESTSDVTWERLRNTKKEPENWLTYSGDYDGQRFSRLSDITRENAASLQRKWVYPIDTSEPIETTPLVADGRMYLTKPPNDVVALDALSGEVIWTFSWPDPGNPRCCGAINRGVAILGDRLYLGTLDARLLAIDSKTGNKKWAVQVADPALGFNITAAPLALNGLIVVGTALAQGNVEFSNHSAADVGSLDTSGQISDNLELIKRSLESLEVEIRSRIAAYDAESGELRWQFHTVPAPGEPGHETWETAYWKIGGSSPWMTGSYDPESNLLYWGVGNPAGAILGAQLRPGDNLYSSSVVALNADTGELVWHYQFTPHDVHDWDGSHIPVLVDTRFAGRQRELLMVANRNGFFYVLDRQNGEFLLAKPFARQSWANGFDAEGRPIVRPNTAPSYEGTVVSPLADGGTSWWSPSYSPNTGLFYVTALDGTETYHIPKVSLEVLMDPAANLPELSRLFVRRVHRDSVVSAVRALDPETGEVRWEFPLPRQSSSGILTTAGDVLFVGDANGEFYALDANNGELLWRAGVEARVHAAPITYRVGGYQFVSIASGKGIYTFGLE
jgi:alcohol dehydrogenase (cytochrome c)